MCWKMDEEFILRSVVAGFFVRRLYFGDWLVHFHLLFIISCSFVLFVIIYGTREATYSNFVGIFHIVLFSTHFTFTVNEPCARVSKHYPRTHLTGLLKTNNLINILYKLFAYLIRTVTIRSSKYLSSHQWYWCTVAVTN